MLARIQRRRMMPTVFVQGLQRVLHARLIMPAINGRELRPPMWLVKLVRRVPVLSVFPALAVGVGPRPERAPGWARGSSRGDREIYGSLLRFVRGFAGIGNHKSMGRRAGRYR